MLKWNPNHLGANHDYIHALEASRHPERAAKSGDRLRTLAPASGHLVHMPAHMYERTGNDSGAAEANEKAAAADRDYIRKYGSKGMYPMMYDTHNLQFGSASYCMDGSYSDDRAKAIRDYQRAVEAVDPSRRSG